MSSSRFGLVALLAFMAGVYLSCTSTKKSIGPEPVVPAAPYALGVVQTTQTSITLHWGYNSTAITGFHLYVTADSTTAFNVVDSPSATARQSVIDSLQPGHPYYFYLTAYSTDGESTPSDTLHTATSPLTPLHAPDQVVATATSSDSVHVTWRINGGQDYFVVQRHDSGSFVWSTLDSLVSSQTTGYYDTTVSAATSYYYRVGAKNSATTAWSVDSAYVAVPTPGAPSAPINLQAVVHLEINSVVLTWTNVSADVDSILVSRNISGFEPQNIAYVSGTTTTYTDSLGTAYNNYSYRLRAINAYGQTWSQPVSVNYRLCSSGVIPLCVGNYWIYSVTDTTNGPFSVRRDVFHAAFFQNRDFYLVGNSQGGRTDSIYYLRNDPQYGCSMLHWPYIQSEDPQLLFKYPAGYQDSYVVDGDSVKVIEVGGHHIVGDTTYTNVYIYQRFLGSPNHWIHYYVEPNDVGIVKELEYTGTVAQPILRATRTLTSFNVLNNQ